jgi:hypothetical protein
MSRWTSTATSPGALTCWRAWTAAASPAQEEAPVAEPDREQIAIVLDRIAEHSSDGDIREHVRQVSLALRGNGVIFVNGPDSQGEQQATGS